ncbi:hypothetical protein GYN07_20910 [Rhizobium leguminosarum bv. viciae 248]|uniref:hypothetical protein n=1 Tax=Rhizobium leguminosarum TaxID=384 RepID=UPI00036212BA|nr:hypothetical protein [Rhizobium leguminosarum]QPZ93569.1 hypothetical protein GYN07_20910 [Rhizobium leguminosarum bv. viciae 248]
MAFPSKQTRSALAPAAQKAAAQLRKEKKEPVVTDKQRAAIHAMVFEGQKRPDAAKTAGMHDESLRLALTKPNVLAYLNQQMEVLRTSGRPRALHTMIDLLDSKNDSTKFKAAEYLDGQNRGNHTIGATQVNVQVNNTVSVTPGYVIRLGRTAPQIEHLEAHGPKGLPDQADVPEEE